MYGRGKTGKTTLWSTFPKPILSIICSGSNQPDEVRSIDTKENRKTINEVTIINSGEITELADKQAETELFATVVVDHVTGVQDMILKEILGLDELPPQSSWGQATQQQYGQCTL